MKKFLFTLASLVAFGFAANAADPVMGFSEYEITLGAGQEQEIMLSIQDLGGAAIKGFQINFEMQDAEGNLVTEGVHLGYLEKYGNADKFAWFGGVGYTLSNGNTVSQSNGEQHQTDAWDEEGDYMPGNPYGVEAHVIYTGKYNLILTNAQTGTCYPSRGQTYPQDIIAFTVQVDEGWDAEYAILTMVKADFSTTAGTKHCEFISLKINNADYAPVVEPKDLTGEIVIGEPNEEGVIEVSYTGEEEVTMTVTINGEVVEAPYQLAEGENEVVVTVEAEGYNTLTKTETITYTAPVVGPKDLTGEIIIGDADEDGYVTIEYTGDEEVTIRVMVDGVYVPLTDGKIFLGAYGESEVTVEVSAEGYNTLTETKIVNWEEPVLETLTGEIVIGEPDENGVVTVTYTGEENVTILVNGEPYEGEIQLEEGENVIVITVTAEGYEPIEETFTIVWTAPVVLEDLTGEIIVSEPDENGFVTVTYTGDEDVTITVNGEPYEDGVQLNDGENTLVVVVSAAGYNDMEETFTVTWTAPEPPYETPAPEVTYVVNDDAVVFTATGEGTVTLYIQYIDNETGDMTVETYVGEGTVSQEVARGEEATFVNVWAAAQANEDAMPGISDVQYYVEIPAKEGGVEPPVDPHMTGFWMVMLDANGEPVWYEMTEGSNGDYTTTVSLDYETYGYVYYDATTPGERHNVDYYFIINGVRYGAPEAEVATVLGTALDNELFTTEGFYTLPVGYHYNMGVAIGPDGDYYVYAAQAGFVNVDELNANKTVAGVRYYNLAGQEMQQANGMTIVVTTYTDGTTSAVKVMK